MLLDRQTAAPVVCVEYRRGDVGRTVVQVTAVLRRALNCSCTVGSLSRPPLSSFAVLLGRKHPPKPSHILITGASSGLGEGFALHYAAPGVRQTELAPSRLWLAHARMTRTDPLCMK